jgi:O-antigen/teichoic acid export membrane protein
MIQTLRLFFADTYIVRLVKNSSWLFFANVGTSAIGFFEIVLVARLLGVEDYGLLALIMTYNTMVNQFIDLRVWETVTKYVSEFWVKGDVERAQVVVKLSYLADFLTGMFSFILVILSASLAANHILRRPGLEALIFLCALGFFFSTVDGTSKALLRVFDKFSWLALYNVGFAALRLGVVVTLVVNGLGLRGVLIGYAISRFCGGLLLLGLALGATRGTLGKAWKEAKLGLLKGRFKEIGSFLLNTSSNSFFKMVTTEADVVLLGYFTSPMEVGYYKLAANFASVLTRISDPVYTAIFPELSGLWSSGNKTAFSDLLKKTSVLLGSVAFPIFMLLTLGSKMIIDLMAGESYRPAALPLAILAGGFYFGMIFCWSRPAILSMGKAHIPTLVLLFLTFPQTVALVLIVPVLGATGNAMIQASRVILNNSFLVIATVIAVKAAGRYKEERVEVSKI